MHAGGFNRILSWSESGMNLPKQDTGPDRPGASVIADRVSKIYTGYSLFRRSPKSGVRAALTDVSFRLYPGETLGLLGPNGAGKTTLLKIIATLLAPTSGRVLINGVDVKKDSIGARRSLGMISSDERSFYWRLTGRQNLNFFAALYRIPERVAKERIAALLEVLGLTYAADRKFHGYSSGMKQKLAIARGLMNEPHVVLYDEPTRALDPLSAQQIRRWIQENQVRASHQAHLLATNQLYEAEQLCQRVMIVNRGSIIAYGTIDEIRRSWREYDFAVHTISCIGGALSRLTPDPENGLLEVSFVEPEHAMKAGSGPNDGARTLRIRTLKNSEALHHTLTAIAAAGGIILQCDSEKVSFDDIFCALVAGDQPKVSEPLTEVKS
jgi:ABC-2 type transport system ATP-binding protein